MSYTVHRIFKSHCRNYVMPNYATHEENSIDAQNPNHICPLKLFLQYNYMGSKRSECMLL